MKLHLKHNPGGLAEADGDDDVLRNLLAEEEKCWDFRDGSEVLTAAARRMILAQHSAEIGRPAREAFVARMRYGKEAILDEKRAQSVGTGSAGLYICPQGFVKRVFAMQKVVEPLFDETLVTVVETPQGTLCNVPLIDDTSSSAAILAESGTAVVGDLTFDQLQLATADKWSTKMVKCSLEFLQDSAFDVETFLAGKFAPQFRRGIGNALTTTLTAGAALGVAVGSGILTDDIFNLFASVDPEYLASPSCCWLMRQATFVTISKLKDTAGEPIFPMTRGPNGYFELLTVPVRFSPSVPAIGVGAKSVFLGDLSYLVMRRVANSMLVQRFDELYATVGQVGFKATVRVSSGFAKASGADAPVKYLQHS